MGFGCVFTDGDSGRDDEGDAVEMESSPLQTNNKEGERTIINSISICVYRRE